MNILTSDTEEEDEEPIYYNNIVCTVRMPVHERINLRRVARKTLNVISNMGNKHAVSFRFTNPTMTCSLYDTGSLIHCGGNNMVNKIERVRELIDRFQSNIPEVKSKAFIDDLVDYSSDYEDENINKIVDVKNIPITVVNTMATIKMPYKINLMRLNQFYPMMTSYFKENFTGCTVTLFKEIIGKVNGKDVERKITATVFTTGSLNLCGCRSENEYRQYSNKIKHMLNHFTIKK